jgi:hypothetical protein
MLQPPSFPSPQHALPPPGLISVFLFFLIVFLYLGGDISGFNVDFSNTSSSCPAYSTVSRYFDEDYFLLL